MVMVNGIRVKLFVRTALKLAPHQAHAVVGCERRNDFYIFFYSAFMICGAIENVVVSRPEVYPVVLKWCFNLVSRCACSELEVVRKL